MLFIFVFIFSGIILILLKRIPKTNNNNNQNPKSYPIIGSLLAFNRKDRFRYIADILRNSATSTFIYHEPFSRRRVVMTANPDVVRHLLKDNFHNYQRGHAVKSVLNDLLGDGIVNADGHTWKFQRKLASTEFNTRSLRRFVEKVVDTELFDRLMPIMAQASANDAVLDLQDLLQRFAFDNICRVAFGYDPGHLLLAHTDSSFATTFDDAVSISSQRFRSFFHIQWKIKKLLGIGSENRLKDAISVIRGFAIKIIREKKKELMLSTNASVIEEEEEDILSRFLKAGHSDEQFVTQIVINFILGGRDTTSSALTWFFWLISKNPRIEQELLREINTTTKFDTKSASSEGLMTLSPYDEAKEMVYLHACLCESMRLYPPVPGLMREVKRDDILPDGTRVRRGEKVSCFPYAMGRSNKIWGDDWAEFRPERWLEKDKGIDGVCKWRFVSRDPCVYPVFNAGPRTCLGKEMAFLQMKRVVAGIMKRFKVVSMLEDGFEPIYVFNMTSKMKGGFPVRFIERELSI